jgi:hypothetical protein
MEHGTVRRFQQPRMWSTAVLIMLLAALWVASTAGAGSADSLAPSAAAPTLISYQGIVEVDDQPYQGTGYFKFAIVDTATGDGTANHWANDGTATGEPVGGVSLSVSDGLFNVLLGDTSLPGMTQPLNATAFVATNTYLRVWFSPSGGAGSYEALEPNQRIASVAYALRTEQADMVDGFHAAAMPTAFNLIPLDGNAYLRVPRLVDHDDAGFYLDPASSSNLNEVEAQRVGVNGLDSASGYYVQDATGNDVDYGLYVEGVDQTGVRIENPGNFGVSISQSTDDGIYILGAGDDGILIDDATDQGVRILGPGGVGVYVGNAAGTAGVYLDSPTGDGFFVNSPGGNGLQVSNATDQAVYIYNPQSDGLAVDNAGEDGVTITDATNDGVYVFSPGRYGVYVDDSVGSGFRVENAGGSGLYVDTPVYNGVHVVSAGTNGVRIESPTEDGLHVSNAVGDGVEVATAANGLRATGITYYGVDAEGEAGGAYLRDSDSGVYAYIASGVYGIWTNGTIDTSGTKSFVQPDPTDPTQAIYYAALEGGEAGTYYRGSGQLVDGTAVVELPEHFSLVTEEEGLTVQVTPRADCNGLYVAEVTTRRIVVKELHGGTSNARFDFFINGVRLGYQDFQVLRPMPEVSTPPRSQAEPLGLP